MVVGNIAGGTSAIVVVGPACAVDDGVIVVGPACAVEDGAIVVGVPVDVDVVGSSAAGTIVVDASAAADEVVGSNSALRSRPSDDPHADASNARETEHTKSRRLSILKLYSDLRQSVCRPVSRRNRQSE